MSNVKFLAMKVNLPKLLKIDHPDKDRGTDPEDQRWSAFDICEAWAFKRGYVNARSNRPDINRAANHILR